MLLCKGLLKKALHSFLCLSVKLYDRHRSHFGKLLLEYSVDNSWKPLRVLPCILPWFTTDCAKINANRTKDFTQFTYFKILWVDFHGFNELTNAKVYSDLCQTSKMELFIKKVNGYQSLIIFWKRIHLRCLRGFLKRFCEVS